MQKRIRTLINSSGKHPCQICGQPHFLETHHIRGREIQDYDWGYNKCQICPNCHTDIHRKMIIVEDWRMTSDGLTLIWHRIGEESQTGTDAVPFLI